MNYDEYRQLFDDVLSEKNRTAPYDKESYQHYTRLNQTRMNRWDKHLLLSDELVTELKSITAPQHWLIITEPWCGDASHIVPFLIRMTEENPLITYDIILRDAPPFLIESYLTNGSKGIPKLIVREEHGKDIFTWGPRPAAAHSLRLKLKEENADAETQKVALQNWYNENKGRDVCEELMHELVNARAMK